MLIVAVPAACIFAAIDAGSKPDWAFEAARTNKALWIVLPVVGIVIVFVGVIALVLWFIVFQPRVTPAVQRGREGASIAS
jgi:hypothetical protein